MYKIRKSVTSSALMTTFALFTANSAHSEPRKVSVPVTDVYAPMGFDTNDVTQVIVAGYLPTLCYKSPIAEVVVKDNIIHITMTSLYEVNPTVACAVMVNPFLEKVDVGVLPAGDYEVRVNENNRRSLNDKITVTQTASLDINDHLYARVDYVERMGTSRTIKLNGWNPSDCFELDEIRYISNGKNTYSVLPIMKKVREFCPRKMIEFHYESVAPTDLTAESLLLHIRVMKGDSVNTLFDKSAIIGGNPK